MRALFNDKDISLIASYAKGIFFNRDKNNKLESTNVQDAIDEVTDNITNLPYKLKVTGISQGRLSLTSGGTLDLTIDTSSVQNAICVLDLAFLAPTVGVQYINCIRNATNGFRITSTQTQTVVVNALVLYQDTV